MVRSTMLLICTINYFCEKPRWGICMLDRAFIFKFYNISIWLNQILVAYYFKSLGIYNMLVALSGLSMRWALFIVLKQLFLLNEAEGFSFEQKKNKCLSHV